VTPGPPSYAFMGAAARFAHTHTTLHSWILVRCAFSCYVPHAQGIISGLGRELNTGLSSIKNVIQVGNFSYDKSSPLIWP
jgi:hypothetical protein